jgi:cell division protein FtsZ
MPKDMKFDLPKDQSSIIKVIGVGGGGSNAVNHMYLQGIDGVDFLICNTDQQALDISPVPHKIQLGSTLTEGRGAGSIPEVGKNAAIENIDQIKDILKTNTKMVFITAGMGGGTGTGAAPIIAEAAKEMGILTVGIVTLPFFFEGRRRKQQADEGIKSIKQHVDTLLIINNDKLREMYGNLSVGDAFDHADNVLTTASKGIAEIITRTGYINVDFEDVRTVMTEGGVAIMGSSSASGDNRAVKAVEQALSSPLLNDNQIYGAKYILLNISFGTTELKMDEISDITDFIQDEAGESADIIWGYGQDESLGDEISVTLIATGFNSKEKIHEIQERDRNTPRPKVYTIDDEVKTTLTNPVQKPFSYNTPEVKKQEEPTFKEEPQPIKKETPTKQSSIEFDLTPRLIEKPEDKKEESKPEEKKEESFLKPKSTDSIKPQIIHKLDDFEEDTDEEVSIPAPTFTNTFTNDTSKLNVEVEEEEEDNSIASLSMAERQKRAEDRMMRLKSLSSRLKTPNGIVEMENEPAYVRRQIKLSDLPHSSESQVSRFTLTETEDENGNKKTELKQNNSFLHDNVD